jgi:hypothetical protein
MTSLEEKDEQREGRENSQGHRGRIARDFAGLFCRDSIRKRQTNYAHGMLLAESKEQRCV